MAAEQLTDKEIQFRKRARRRLVGAVALVLLMVTILPMVLDDRGDQKAPQPEIAINIPSQDAGFSSKIVPIAAAPAVPAAKPEVQMTPPLEQPHDAKMATVAPQPAPAEKAKPAEPTKPAAKAPVEEKSAVVAPKPEPVRKAEADKPAQPAPSELKKPVEAKKGMVSVQVGVFSDAAKVKQMRAKLAQAGAQCNTENLNTPKGIKLRLRCGPYADRAAAQQGLDKIKSAGFDGILVTNQ
jgi:DedD protein